MASLLMMSSSQEERDRLRKASQNGYINYIKEVLSSGVNVNADVSNIKVSKYYMSY